MYLQYIHHTISYRIISYPIISYVHTRFIFIFIFILIHIVDSYWFIYWYCRNPPGYHQEVSLARHLAWFSSLLRHQHSWESRDSIHRAPEESPQFSSQISFIRFTVNHLLALLLFICFLFAFCLLFLLIVPLLPCEIAPPPCTLKLLKARNVWCRHICFLTRSYPSIFSEWRNMENRSFVDGLSDAQLHMPKILQGLRRIHDRPSTILSNLNGMWDTSHSVYPALNLERSMVCRWHPLFDSIDVRRSPQFHTISMVTTLCG